MSFNYKTLDTYSCNYGHLIMIINLSINKWRQMLKNLSKMIDSLTTHNSQIFFFFLNVETAAIH